MFKHFKQTFQILAVMLGIATLTFLCEIAGKDVPVKKRNRSTTYEIFA